MPLELRIGQMTRTLKASKMRMNSGHFRTPDQPWVNFEAYFVPDFPSYIKVAGSGDLQRSQQEQDEAFQSLSNSGASRIASTAVRGVY